MTARKNETPEERKRRLAWQQEYESVRRKKEPEKVRARQRKWYRLHTDKANAWMAEWYKANSDRAKAIQAKYRAENPDKRQANSARYHARKISAIQVENCPRVNAIYFIAAWLRSKGDDVHVDHIIPLSKGGPHVADNLQILTATENMRKGAKLP